MRRWPVIAVIASCVIHHHIQILLGPSPGNVSAGFLCDDPAKPTALMFFRAHVVDPAQTPPDRLQFSMVVDVVDLGGTYPGCIGEDIEAACKGGACKLLRSIAPVRACLEVDVPFDPQNQLALLQDFLSEHGSSLIDDAPDTPVVIRVAATTQPCAELTDDSDPLVWPDLKSDNALTSSNVVLGCAYNCASSLDEIGDTLSLQLDLGIGMVTNDQCISAIDGCAVFPSKP